MSRRSAAQKLSRADRKAIEAAVRAARGEDKKQPATAQASIPYIQMYPDGVCHVAGHFFSKTIAFEDTNYQLSENDDKQALFGKWCELHNYFDSSMRFQYSYMNLYGGQEELEKTILSYTGKREQHPLLFEYTSLLQRLLSKGNNGLKRQRYLSFGIDAESYRVAKQRLERIELEIIYHFKQLGVSAEGLNGKDRLQLMHSIFRLGTKEETFRFDWKWLPQLGLSTKDFIAPSSFEFSKARGFRMGKCHGTASFLNILAPEIDDRMLKEFLNIQSSLIVSMQIRSIDQAEAIKMVRNKLSDLDSMKIEEQKKAVRAGYDMDIIPSDLAVYGLGAKNLLQDLQSRNEHMFLVTFLLININEKPLKLRNDLRQAKSIAQKYTCPLVCLDYQQEQGLMSALPLAYNQVPIERTLTTSAAAIFIPFTSRELCQLTPEAVCYGVNPLSNNLILMDRKLLKAPNGLILGKPGSGKSFIAKFEMLIIFFLTMDTIIVLDPESEYAALVNAVNGQVIRISPNSNVHINPMEIHVNYGDGENPIPLKVNFLLSMFEIIVNPAKLTFGQKAVIEKAARMVYNRYFEDPRPEKMPILSDLLDALIEIRDAQKGFADQDANDMAKALDQYVNGTFNLFNHQTDVDMHNRFVCFDTKDAGSQLKALAMHIIQDYVWGRVSENRTQKKTTRYYCDEFHLLLKDEITASYCAEIWKRFRKWGGIPTAITQNVKDLLKSQQADNIFENSDFILMLNQAPGDRTLLEQLLNISPDQSKYITNSGEGEGLILYGDTLLPFRSQIGKDTQMYRLMTTKLSEVADAE